MAAHASAPSFYHACFIGENGHQLERYDDQHHETVGWGFARGFAAKIPIPHNNASLRIVCEQCPVKPLYEIAPDGTVTKVR
jgi:hypothetical protein